MKLTEYEGKELLAVAGLQVHRGELLPVADFDSKNIDQAFPVYAKAQVLHGNRAAQNLVAKIKTQQALVDYIKHLKEAHQQIKNIALEPVVDFEQSVYLSVGYDTRSRSLVTRYLEEGGDNMDQRLENATVVQLAVNKDLETFEPHPSLVSTINALKKCLLDNDATLVEINPLVKDKTNQKWVCLDAKIELEDQAAFRHQDWEQYGNRSDLGRPPTKREQQAHQVSAMDHRGVAGESFFEFPGGTIGVMASGGGASTLAMDALMSVGLQPANYTEYSGNPTREKTAALADVVLSIPDLEAFYVVGSNANFTDIYETLAGVVDGLLRSQYAKQTNQSFVILVRRGGPRWQEAFEMVRKRLEKTHFSYKLYGPEFPLVQTAEELKKLL